MQLNSFSILVLTLINFNFTMFHSPPNTTNNIISYTKEVNVIQLAPKSLQIYYYIKKYSKLYNVPEKISFGIAKIETGYIDPLDYTYQHNRCSNKGAIGIYQLMPKTANFIGDSTYSKSELANNVELNVKLGIKYIRYLYEYYDNNWGKALGAYNTGKPIINSYAKKILL